jgi:peptidoglycan/xylan/chitin deacetylase (PgdA/CDA1 family)
MAAVMWTVNSLDWRLTARQIVERVVGQARPGSIILLHDGVPPRVRADRLATVEALPEILRELQARYRLVTVSELQSTASLSRNEKPPP